MPLRTHHQIKRRLTKSVDDEFQRRDEFVSRTPLPPAIRQKHAVTGALVITSI